MSNQILQYIKNVEALINNNFIGETELSRQLISERREASSDYREFGDSKLMSEVRHVL